MDPASPYSETLPSDIGGTTAQSTSQSRHTLTSSPSIKDLIKKAGGVDLSDEQRELIAKVVAFDRKRQKQIRRETILPDTTHDFIFQSLSPVELFRYSLLNKAAYQAVHSFRRRAFDITKALSRYFISVEIPQFRLIQASAGVLISGSFALQFFDRTNYPESDLDLYVLIHQCAVVANFLKSCGYVFQPRATQQDSLSGNIARAVSAQTDEQLNDGYVSNGIAGVFTLVKNGKKIQIIAAKTSSIEVILQFHSTCVMNVITHANAYSFFPRATFESRRTVLTRDTTGFWPADMVNAEQKYKTRGWTFVDVASSLETLTPKSEFSSFGVRHIGDHACWTIPLSSFEDLSTEDDLWLNSWKIVWEINRSMKIDFVVLYGPGFRYGKCATKGLAQALSKAMRDTGNSRNDAILGQTLRALTSPVDDRLKNTQKRLYDIFLQSGLETPALPSACAADRLVSFMADLYTSFPPECISCTFHFQKEIPCRGPTWLKVSVVIRIPREPRRAFIFEVDRMALQQLKYARIEVDVKKSIEY
ncbi:hypothetical protein D9758_011343 [Tetrapyrgos nigripes]|uniref:Uncharacterized protein n=1 Tax=Tetrapyrgos nigripes TaxID=182062 RepID=A0A8H5G8G9_9AGAR|nr:hypothetical protein D9758_011343 [Tetrapyrgos nigripes]